MKFKVRFAPQKSAKPTQLPSPCSPDKLPTINALSKPTIHQKSKQGCKECKRRRVKCDENFPICLRCQRRGAVCIAEPKLTTWQLEMPALNISMAPKLSNSLGSHVNMRLLQKWLERTSQIMVLNPEINPLSYPILKLLTTCPWLASVLQSISAGHETSFDQAALQLSMTERNRALSSMISEIANPQQPYAATLIGIFLLGVSTCWIDGDRTAHGKEHLFGARAILQLMLQDPYRERDEIEQFAIGTFLYWDMSCSLIVDPQEQAPLDLPEIFVAVSRMRSSYHPMSGFAIELFYLLGILGRYCRRVIDSGIREIVLEETIEQQILNWEAPQGDHELEMLGEAFRAHGLILLYSICGTRTESSIACSGSPDETVLSRSPTGSESQWDWPDDEWSNESTTDSLTRAHALNAIEALKSTPITSSHFIMQPIPLLTAGSALWDEDFEERQVVRDRFNALYSMNRAPVNKWAMQLLEEVWEWRHQGNPITWIELMLQKGWRFSMG